jgi:hypothetical protein
LAVIANFLYWVLFVTIFVKKAVMAIASLDASETFDEIEHMQN